VRSWLVIPAMGVACGGAAVALGMPPAIALVGAAFAAVIRVLDGDSPAALAAAVVAPVLALASLAEAGGELTRTAIALAAVGWTVTELAWPVGDDVAAAWPRSLIAVVPAVIAAILDPSFAALIAIAGARLVALPSPRPRWVLAVPVAGVAVIGLAVLAGTSWTGLGARWFGGAAHPVALPAFAEAAGAALGPVSAVAAIAGLTSLARARYAELALAAAIAGAVAVDLRAGALGIATIGLAAVLAGLAIGRLAALIRLPSGQAFAGATAGVLLIVPPAWTAVERRAPIAGSSQLDHTGTHSGRASR
jgi:hypothetical protein